MKGLFSIFLCIGTLYLICVAVFAGYIIFTLIMNKSKARKLNKENSKKLANGIDIC